MKIAILHNSLDTIGGAEKVTLTLAKTLNADIYTTNINNKNIKLMGFNSKNIFSIGKIPTNQPYKHTSAFNKFKKLKLNGYNKIIICGDWAISAANHNNCIWYCHSPMREIFDLYEFTKNNIIKPWQRPFFIIWANYHKKQITKYAQKVEIICNSNNTKKRIQKYFKKQATIIHPGIDTNKFKNKKSESYWFSNNRLIHHKHIEDQLEIFSKLKNEKLIINGCKENADHFLQYHKQLKIPQNVTIVNNKTEKEIIDLYAKCKGFITTAKNEDFGITPIEAMASGKAVIATNEGGYKETIINNKTGFLVKNKKEIINAINNISKIKKQDCIKQAKKFDNKLFIKKIKKQLHIK